jgi:ABC-type transporter Mla subunit MlaD
MSTQNFSRPQTGNTQSISATSEGTSKTERDVLSSASALAEETAGKVKEAASETAATVTGEVKNVLNRQVGGGADMLGFVARSAKRAAEDLERDSPQIAGLVRTVATQIDGYAEGLRDQSVDRMWQTAADFTRRQPALVFGLAALAGFFALRTLKSTPSIAAPPIQPSQSHYSGRTGQ